MKSSEWVFRIAAPLGGVLFALLIVEAGLRMFGVDPLGDITGPRTFFLRESDHPELAYELTPGATGTWGERAIRINSWGFRDREIPHAKSPGTRRIIVIGDSITFGYGMAPEQRFPDQLQARFRAAGANVEVLNLGVGGYDTLDEVAFLEHVGLDFSPDLVVVGYCINDLGVQSVNLRTIKVVGRYGWLIRHSRLLQLLTVRVDRVGLHREMLSLNAEGEFRRRNAGRILPLGNDPAVLEPVASLRAALAASGPSDAPPYLDWYTSASKLGKLRFSFTRLAKLAGDHGFEVVVVVFPFLDEGEHADAFRTAYALVGHEARRAGFEVIDLRDAYAAIGFESLMLLEEAPTPLHPNQQNVQPTPLHPNERGHRIAADRLFESLERRWR